MDNDFQNIVAYYIMAIAWERHGRNDIAMEFWNKITCAGDVIDSIASTEPGGLFEEEK